MNLVECMDKPEVCPLMSEGCRLNCIISRSLDTFVDEMSKYTLGDI